MIMTTKTILTIFFLIFKDSIIKKMLTYENKMNLLSNYVLTRKVIGVNGNVFDH